MLFTFFALMTGYFASPQTSPVTATMAQMAPFYVPPYAKWGKYAMVQAQKRYPSYVITDYLHVGRTIYTSTYAKETFKFWLQGNNTEFGVYVNVYFDPNTSHVTRVLFCETDH